jgi:hypothetical protein
MIYILQKDLPDAKAGQRFVWIEGDGVYSQKYERRDVKENYSFHEPCAYFRDSIRLMPNTSSYTKEFVENNPEWFLPEEDNEVPKAKELLKSKGYLVIKKVAADDSWDRIYNFMDLRSAFCAAQMMLHTCGGMKFRFKSISGYLDSLNKNENETMD